MCSSPLSDFFLVFNTNRTINPPLPPSFLRRIAEVAVGDETGIVTLRARNGQVDFLLQGLREAEEEEKKPFVVVVRNAGVAMYKGYMRLIVNKWGKLSRYFPLFLSSLRFASSVLCPVCRLWRCETEGPCFLWLLHMSAFIAFEDWPD